MQWFGHVTRMSKKRLVSQFLLAKITENRPRGRPSTRRDDYISDIAGFAFLWRRPATRWDKRAIAPLRNFQKHVSFLGTASSYNHFCPPTPPESIHWSWSWGGVSRTNNRFLKTVRYFESSSGCCLHTRPSTEKKAHMKMN